MNRTFLFFGCFLILMLTGCGDDTVEAYNCAASTAELNVHPFTEQLTNLSSGLVDTTNWSSNCNSYHDKMLEMVNQGCFDENQWTADTIFQYRSDLCDLGM